METKKAKNVWFSVNGNTVGYSCDFIEFTKSTVYAKMLNSVECKYQLLCDGITFDVTSDREHITVGIDIENLIAVEF